MFAFTDKPQKLLELITHGLKLFKISFKACWIWSLVLAVITTIYPLYFVKLSEDIFMGITSSHRIAATLGWLILAPILVFFTAMIIRRIYVSGAKVDEDVPTSSVLVAKKVIPLYLAMILLVFITTIGFYLAFLPGIFFAVLFIFVAPIIVIDREPILKAFKISAYLVWGNWWRIFLIVLLPLAIMSFVAVFTFKLPLFIGSILQMVETWFIVPLFYSMVLNGYSDAKLRHKMKPLKTKGAAETT